MSQLQVNGCGLSAAAQALASAFSGDWIAGFGVLWGHSAAWLGSGKAAAWHLVVLGASSTALMRWARLAQRLGYSGESPVCESRFLCCWTGYSSLPVGWLSSRQQCRRLGSVTPARGCARQVAFVLCCDTSVHPWERDNSVVQVCGQRPRGIPGVAAPVVRLVRLLCSYGSQRAPAARWLQRSACSLVGWPSAHNTMRRVRCHSFQQLVGW